MKVLVVGYGSMGRRRIRLLKSIREDIEFICVDSNQERMEQAKSDGNLAYTKLTEAIEKRPKIAFVCTSPGHHAEIILLLIDAGIHVFTELNLISDQYEKIMEESNKKNVKLFMSSTMLYNKSIQKIKELVQNQKQSLTYVYHIGQYLPDWHPWESYKDLFIGRKETNGVREILAIQLPWLLDTFGEVACFHSSMNRCTNLDIDFQDSIITTFEHKNGTHGVFIADTVSRKAITSLEIVGEEIHIFWHGHNDDLEIYNTESKQLNHIYAYDNVEHEDGYADNIIENQYIDEIKDFLNYVEEGSLPKYSFEKDQRVLSLIDEIGA